ncbi:MAG: hypothetical protein CTY18_01385 [Methylomonas sp.]|nr:MAG: hypothetical protein CTY24_01640 [Methylobacter sp.]PPD37594.1 MAG: hypothetical protein CTY18_01385 [Methylomonas sp.]
MKNIAHYADLNKDDILAILKKNQRLLFLGFLGVSVIAGALWLFNGSFNATQCTDIPCSNGYKWIYIFNWRICVPC